MHIPDRRADIFSAIASSADICMKPFKYSVVSNSDLVEKLPIEDQFDDFILRLECRTSEGSRSTENDLDLEIYKSGKDTNLILSWTNRNENIYLWQGAHSIWIDSLTGKRIDSPIGSNNVESLARRVRALFQH